MLLAARNFLDAVPLWRKILRVKGANMGDKGGKKDKDKAKKQTTKKHDDKVKHAEEKQPKRKT